MKTTLNPVTTRASSLMILACLAGLSLPGTACKTSSASSDGEKIKEKPANTREFTEQELKAFLATRHFDVYGGVVSSQYVDLDGVAPKELLVQVRCMQDACMGDYYKIQGSNYFLYSLRDSLTEPTLLTERPISLGPESVAQMADIDGDKQKDLLLSGQGRDGTRTLKLYSMLGKLLAARFEGSLPPGSIAQVVLDMDGDGTMEIITIQQQDKAAQNDYNNYYGYNNGSMVRANMLEGLTTQAWSVSRGSLSMKPIGAQDGLVKAFKAMRQEKTNDVMELARLVILMKEHGLTIEDPAPLLDRFMKEYDALSAKGEKLNISQQLDPYAYPQYDAYGNPLAPDEFAHIPSYNLYILLAALKHADQAAVSDWSAKHVARASVLDELSAQLELSLGSAPSAKRDQLANEHLKKAFDVLLTEGPSSANFYNLAYFDPMAQQMDAVQRQFFIASFLLAPDFEFAGREETIKSFLQQSIKNPIVMQTLLPQYPLAQSIAPYLLSMDFSAMPTEFVTIALNQILPTYVSAAQAEGDFSEEAKKKLAASLMRFMSENPDRQNEVLYFVSNYFQDPAFGPGIAVMMSSLRVKFESGRATQMDRDNLYNVANLLPAAMSSLKESDRTWWINYVYRQGMGYSLDTKLAEGCYDLPSQSAAQIDTILSSMEMLPKESTLASMCIPYMLGVYSDGSPSPLSEAQQKRLPKIIDSRLQPGGEEYQIQQFLVTLESYDRLNELAPSLWRLVKKRKGPIDTARYQALVMLTLLNEKGALKTLTDTSLELFTDTSFRTKNPYFNDYFYADILARQQHPEILELMFTLAEHKKIIPNSCILIRDYMNSYGRTSELNEAQQLRYDQLCTGGTGVSGIGMGGGGILITH